MPTLSFLARRYGFPKDEVKRHGCPNRPGNRQGWRTVKTFDTGSGERALPLKLLFGNGKSLLGAKPVLAGAGLSNIMAIYSCYHLTVKDFDYKTKWGLRH